MDCTAEITRLASQLVEAVEVIMNPYVEHDKRLAAYDACERFKETSPYCAQCGLYLARRENPHIVRHFGLQLMEHCVKYRWNDMSQTEKIFIKVILFWDLNI